MADTTPTDADDWPSSTDDRNRDGAHPSRESPERTADLVAVITEGKSGSNECTIYPRETRDEKLVTTWISAELGSYVALDGMR